MNPYKNFRNRDFFRAVINPNWPDPLVCMRYGPASFPKELLRLHLEQLKKGKSPIAESVLLENLEKAKRMIDDKDIIDILYALSDVSPHQSVRNKAREILSGS